MNHIFEELFGSKAKVKILKFFFRNESAYFDLGTIAKRVQERRPIVKKEINRLLKIGFLHKRNKPIVKKYGKEK